MKLLRKLISLFKKTPPSAPSRERYADGCHIPDHLWEKAKGVQYGKYNDIW